MNCSAIRGALRPWPPHARSFFPSPYTQAVLLPRLPAATCELPVQPTNVHSGTTCLLHEHHDASEDKMAHVPPAPAPLHQHTAKPQSGTSQRSPPPQPTLALAGTTRTATTPRIACSPHLQQHSGTHCKRPIHLCRGARCHMQLVLGTLVWTGGYHQSSPLRYVSSMQDLNRNFHGCKTGVMVI